MAYQGNVTDLTPSNTTNPSGKALAEGAYKNNVVDLTPENTTNPRGSDDFNIAKPSHQGYKGGQGYPLPGVN